VNPNEFEKGWNLLLLRFCEKTVCENERKQRSNARNVFKLNQRSDLK
jgi:hypothetical protein